MGAVGLLDHLCQLGLGVGDAEVYLAALGVGPSTVDRLAVGAGVPEGEVRGNVTRLAELGLIAISGADGRGVAPVEPSVALELLAAARAAELRRAQVAVINAYRAYRRSVSPQALDELVEVITGPSIADWIWHHEGNVGAQVLRFDSPPYHTSGGANDIEIGNLGRGVEYRVVYSKSAVQKAAYYGVNIQPCIAAGEQARVLPTVPVKLTVYDRRLATVSMSSVEAEVNDSLLIVRPSSLLSALTGLFETAWRSALPMHLSGRVPSALSPLHRRILELLATGVSDDKIAELLGVSRRTLSRHLEQLTTRAGALTRFQLALHAARECWL